MKSNGIKTWKSIYTCCILAIFLAGMFSCAFLFDRAEPTDPTTQKIDSSLMLIADGTQLSVSEDTIENTSDDKQKTDKEEEEDQDKQEDKKEDQQDRESDDNDGENNGEGNGDGLTDTIYFTTSIKNGETVMQKAYSFSINHKIENLIPKETKIYVNGRLVEEIKDARTEFNIFLAEGENTVKVQVTYETEQGQLISPYKNYMINVDSRSVVITTSLQDEQTVETSYLSFTASAAFGDEDVDLMVTHDGEEIFRNDGVYEVQLKEGQNTFVMYAEYDAKRKAERVCIVNYVPPKGMHIETDLKDQTVKAVDPQFTFRAEVVGGSKRTEFTVTMNNQVITGENGVYTVQLKPQGERAFNAIRLKATDGKNEDSLTFKIKYIPIATPETEPQLTYINIKEGQNIKKKNPFTLELAAADYKGNKIYFDGMEVYLNGNHQILRETKPYVTYHLNFSEGPNEVKIVLTDDDGRIKTYVYHITYVPPDENQKIGTVTISMDANVLGLGQLIAPTTVDLLAGDNLAKVVVRALEARGFAPIYNGSTDAGFYLKAISRSGIGSRCNIPEALKAEITDFGIPWHGSADAPERATNSLGDDDYTAWSGWLIMMDGSYISNSASELDPVDGSIIKIRYTLSYGMDIGSSYQGMTFDNTY